MRVVRQLNSEEKFNRPILTLGTYDGVHLGHQEIIRSLVEKARTENKESVLFTFDPHPRKVLYPESYSVKLIDTVDEKLEKLKELGLDTVILFPFTKEFSRLSAMEFVRDVLVNQIGVSEMHIGHDHHFGKNREGSFQELQELGELYDFSVFQLPAIFLEETAISSTKIRNAILDGNVEYANQLLGSSFVLQGKVVKGQQIGRTIGFPTANIDLDNTEKIVPKNGVYAAQVHIGSKSYHAVMNIGTRPTIANNGSVTIEVYLFDFNEDIYDQFIKVEVKQRIRDEQRFENIEDLKNQIQLDEISARNYFSSLI
ncbi:bifunctional riboflavin kinase/FAD synthetase [Fluviicola taffensis]|uniref:Riboflavin biosynthesis protein n=1 Tax=Fluviicola taffensis (strain DSM 16823 / NCIMB 13979 / RW262) TaxID=755732 RepID=F2I9C2_FLUTR|nr:bifunctional riboflavin kinase/FAD synthetase [Fluviicola taffensis]AEA44079.1 riboflavin biosynthesis protein RibF [Fluviicola taffensis DSM 16823]